MSVLLNAKRKIVLWAAFGLLGSALLLGFILERNFGWWFNDISAGNAFVEGRVLSFLARTGWKPEKDNVSVEKVGNSLGNAQPILLYRSRQGLSTPGIIYLVGNRYVLVGKLFDTETGRDLSPELFGKVPVRFDLERINMDKAHRRGSNKPKVTIIEYGDYGCEACAELEKVLVVLLDNYPEVQHVYKHYPLSEGSRYLAEVAEAAAEQGESFFWDVHKRFFSADKSAWDRRATERFVAAQIKEIGLDFQRIEKALESGGPRRRVSRDQGEFPVGQTPTLVINGEVVVGVVGYSDLRRIVEEKLALKGDSGVRVQGGSADAKR